MLKSQYCQSIQQQIYVRFLKQSKISDTKITIKSLTV